MANYCFNKDDTCINEHVLSSLWLKPHCLIFSLRTTFDNPATSTRYLLQSQLVIGSDKGLLHGKEKQNGD